MYHLNAPQTTKNKKPCKFPEVEEELGHQDLAEISGDAAKNIKPESFGFKPYMDNMQIRDGHVPIIADTHHPHIFAYIYKLLSQSHLV